jgi:hypothetical protein
MTNEAPAAAAWDDAELGRELVSLDRLLGDTRVRFRKGTTKPGSAEKLIQLDLEIRGALVTPRSAALQAEVRSLLGRLHTLDPH